MIIKETECARMECPVGVGPPMPDVESACIGSACMWWRWAQKPNPDWKPPYSMMSGFPQDTRSDPPMYIPDKKRGYCGMAGRP